MRITQVKGWFFKSEDPGLGYSVSYIPRVDWRPAQVPGAIHLDLVANHFIPDPFQECFEETVQWVDGAPWSYPRDVRLAAKSRSPQPE